jgi:hypothetical protein
MIRLMRPRFPFLVILLLLSMPVWGWGRVGHDTVNEAATYGTPSEMPRFFHDAYPQLVWLGYDPDRWRRAGVLIEPMDPTHHYLDYEYVAHLELPPDRFAYLDLQYRTDTLRLQGISNTAAGFLPWRIAELMQTLERQWQLWSSEQMTEVERDHVERSILFISGILGHYVGDAANPHHTTIHYNGWVLAPNPMGFANDCGVHSRFETVFVTKMVERRDVFDRVRPPIRRENYFDAALELVLDSHSLVEQIYTLDRDGAFTGSGTPEGYDFAVSRLATAASWLRDFWWSAYLNGTRQQE